jgi:hypothetical protein
MGIRKYFGNGLLIPVMAKRMYLHTYVSIPLVVGQLNRIEARVARFAYPKFKFWYILEGLEGTFDT